MTTNFEARADQALFLAHDSLVLGWLGVRAGNLLDRLTKIPSENGQGISEELYLSILTRLPTAEEAQEIQTYLAGRSDRTEAFQELAWALMTSAEFRFNH